ncbi:MAG: pyridoxamine 5'-phosphate oxidase [Actinobacteria bacterium]|nr:pyridoxamine 5'-phosphate oxidase [Actinomycetota bacterium]
MTSWREIERAEPDFARRVQARFDAHKHKVMATLRKDGSPRISGIEFEFQDGNVHVGMMLNSRKTMDLRRDPRIALHSGTEEPGESDDVVGQVIDAKLSGRAVERDPAPDHHVFHVDVSEVVLITIGTPPDHLVIETWTPDGGLRSRKRY